MTADVKQGYKQTEVGVIPEDWEVWDSSAQSALQMVKLIQEMNHIGQ